jgi:uncharacterized protein (DUF39 family)
MPQTQSDEKRSRRTSTMQEHIIKALKGVAVFTGITSIGLFSLNYPVLAQRACVKTDAGQKVCGQLLPGNSSFSLDGKYSLAWAGQPGTQCYAGSIADLTISADGFMQGYLANNSRDNHAFSGKVNSDGTWSATLMGGNEFSGTLIDDG